MHIIGDVEGRDCLVVDDLVDTAGTLCNGAIALMEKGATSVHAYATHGVLSGPANNRIDETAALSSLTITDSIMYPYGDNSPSSKVFKVSIADLLAKAIRRTAQETSISELFEDK